MSALDKFNFAVTSFFLVVGLVYVCVVVYQYMLRCGDHNNLKKIHDLLGRVGKVTQVFVAAGSTQIHITVQLEDGRSPTFILYCGHYNHNDRVKELEGREVMITYGENPGMIKTFAQDRRPQWQRSYWVKLVPV